MLTVYTNKKMNEKNQHTRKRMDEEGINEENKKNDEKRMRITRPLLS